MEQTKNERTKPMDATKLIGCECEQCGEFTQVPTTLVSKWECSECQELYDSEEEAKECCADEE